MSDADGIVHGRARELGVAHAVEPRVEVHQLGDQRPHPACSAEALGVRVGDESAVGGVETDHRRVEPGREHALGRLRVGPDVEFGRRRPVPLADRAAHEHDPLRHGVRVQHEQQRDVRERARRHEGHLAVARTDLLGDEVDGVLLVGGGRRLRQLRAVEA